MKEYLGKNGEWLAGEFYAATTDVFEAARISGRKAALAYSNK